MCCNHGKVRVPIAPDPPLLLRQLLNGTHTDSRGFREHIRRYNAALAFTSLGVRVDGTVNSGRGPYVFRIGGELCHFVGSLLPTQSAQPTYAQLYIYDPRVALDTCMRRNPESPDPVIEVHSSLEHAEMKVYCEVHYTTAIKCENHAASTARHAQPVPNTAATVSRVTIVIVTGSVHDCRRHPACRRRRLVCARPPSSCRRVRSPRPLPVVVPAHRRPMLSRLRHCHPARCRRHPARRRRHPARRRRRLVCARPPSSCRRAPLPSCLPLAVVRTSYHHPLHVTAAIYPRVTAAAVESVHHRRGRSAARFVVCRAAAQRCRNVPL
jgi:hypothetical protein